MLTLGIFSNIFTHGLKGLFLTLDSIVYWIISILYDLFYSLANTQFITDTVYNQIANRIYVVIGIVMLFYLSYALLKSLVNPDEFAKITGKIVTNLVISLALIAIVPTIFNYAFRIQNIIIEDDVIDNIVFGNSNNSLTLVGRVTAMNFFEAFATIPENAEIDREDYTTWNQLKIAIVNNEPGVSFLDITYAATALEDYPDEASYTPLVATLCGIFLIYIIFSFCLDMGVRVVKLAFYQIISPIPIVMRILPEKKSVFDNWVKATLATYLEVFIRIFVMYIVAFLCANIFDEVINLKGINIIGKIIIVMGIFAFAKQAPKLIGDMIGVNAGDLKLGIREKIAGGGGFIAGAAIGGGVTSYFQNMSNRWGSAKNWQNKNGKYTAASIGRNLVGGLGSGVTGGLSGMARSGYGARSAKNERDMRNAARQGAQAVVQNRQERENYRANHPGFMGTTRGHLSDIGRNIGALAGLEAPLEQLKMEQENAQKVKSARKAIDDRLSALIERDQNKRVLSGGRTMHVAGIGNFNTLADLRNEIEIMKSTGRTSSGRQVTSQMLTAMANSEFELKKELKKDILNGYDKNGNKISAADFNSKYDNDLRALMTDYRTKSLQYANTISNNASNDQATQISLENFRNQAVQNQNQDLANFVLTNVNYDVYDSSAPGGRRTENASMADIFFNQSNSVINNSTGNINSQLNERIQQENRNSNNNS